MQSSMQSKYHSTEENIIDRIGEKKKMLICQPQLPGIKKCRTSLSSWKESSSQIVLKRNTISGTWRQFNESLLKTQDQRWPSSHLLRVCLPFRSPKNKTLFAKQRTKSGQGWEADMSRRIEIPIPQTTTNLYTFLPSLSKFH